MAVERMLFDRRGWTAGGRVAFRVVLASARTTDRLCLPLLTGALGHGHRYECGSGGLAYVMIQETKGLLGCRRNPWPLLDER